MIKELEIYHKGNAEIIEKINEIVRWINKQESKK